MINNSRLAHAINHCLQRRSERPVGAGWIYFIQCEQYIKIGITKGDLAHRISVMQTNCPFELKLLKTIYSPKVLRHETLLHNMVSMYHHRGEWFTLPMDKLDWVIRAFDAIVQGDK